jgi:hypothetical protein
LHFLTLVPHPATPCALIQRLDARAQRIGETILELHYVVGGEIDRLRIPIPDAPRRTDGLWQHTCFEAFAAEAGGSAYHEFNFAPSSAWAMYAFDAYRDGMHDVYTAVPPRISTRREQGQLTLDVVVDLASLPSLRGSPVLRLGLAAVIEDAEGGLSYWALKHPSDKPDFHHAEGFVLELSATGTSDNAQSDFVTEPSADPHPVVRNAR